jgi:hypothetical protein
MALTPAEKQRAYRERQKKIKRANLKSGSLEAAQVSKRLFSDTFQSDPNAAEFELALGIIGMVAPAFDDERGPTETALSETIDGVIDPFGNAYGALGRAEVTIGCLIDAAVILAGIVNTHLKIEINDRLAELEDPQCADRATAIKEAVELNKMLDRLDTQVRWTFPQWKVAGN